MKVLLFVFLVFTLQLHAQPSYNFASLKDPVINSAIELQPALTHFAKRKLFQRNTGMIIGLQRGKFNSLELGAEAHWRKISLFKPHIIGATTNLEYNFENNVVGYKAGIWMKRGRINLTYGANISYFTDFKEGNRFGFGPSVGFRLLGLHLINGYNFLTKNTSKPDAPPIEVNSLYMSLRYYFPVNNKFTWDRKTMKKKRERKKAREERKKERKKNREKGDGKGFLNIF